MLVFAKSAELHVIRFYWAYSAFRGEKTAFLPGLRRFSRFSPKLMQKPSVFLGFSGSAGCFLFKNAVFESTFLCWFSRKAQNYLFSAHIGRIARLEAKKPRFCPE